jgi:hypothetical protein
VQSIVPVRKSFLDSYPGDIILFRTQAFWRTGPLRPDLLRTAALNAGRSITAEQALDLSCRLSSRDFRSGELPHVVRVEPPVERVPPFAETLWEQQRHSSREWLRKEFNWFPGQFPFVKNFEPEKSSDWWFDYYYALVNPEQRHAHPNYEARLHNATLTVLPCADLAVYYSPARVHGEK